MHLSWHLLWTMAYLILLVGEGRSCASIFGTLLALLIIVDPHVDGMVRIEDGIVMVLRFLVAIVVEVEASSRMPCKVVVTIDWRTEVVLDRWHEAVDEMWMDRAMLVIVDMVLVTISYVGVVRSSFQIVGVRDRRPRYIVVIGSWGNVSNGWKVVASFVVHVLVLTNLIGEVLV